MNKLPVMFIRQYKFLDCLLPLNILFSKQVHWYSNNGAMNKVIVVVAGSQRI